MKVMKICLNNLVNLTKCELKSTMTRYLILNELKQ